MAENVEVVERMYHCFRTGDLATLKAEVFAEDIVFNLPGHHPLAGTKRGINEVLAFFGKLRTLGAQVQPIGIGELSSGAVAEVYRANAEVNGVNDKWDGPQPSFLKRPAGGSGRGRRPRREAATDAPRPEPEDAPQAD